MSSLEENSQVIERLRSAIDSVFLGKPHVVEGSLVALLGQGHVLIEDVPGVGKTLLAQSLARTLGGTFRRVQFTPDLLPSDIIGSSLLDRQTSELVFQPGPVFANVVLADEINRTSPRTQSALLEAMNDRQVSVDGRSHPLPTPFLVVATQNPFEFEGTYPLPESQLDRFMTCLAIGYPAREVERKLLDQHRDGNPAEVLTPAVTLDEVRELQHATQKVTVGADVSDYLLDLVHATREHPELHVGASTRGALMLYRAGQALALLRGRDYVRPDDIKEIAPLCLPHRVIPKSFTQRQATTGASAIIQEILDTVAVPE